MVPWRALAGEGTVYHLSSTVQAEVTLRCSVKSWGNMVLQLRTLFSGGEREGILF